MDFTTNTLQIENMEKEFIRPSHTLPGLHKPKPLVVQKSTGFRNEQWASQKACGLFCHRKQKIVFFKNVAARYWADEIFLFFTTITVAPCFEKISRRE